MRISEVLIANDAGWTAITRKTLETTGDAQYNFSFGQHGNLLFTNESAKAINYGLECACRVAGQNKTIIMISIE
jgi:hypothetical protein